MLSACERIALSRDQQEYDRLIHVMVEREGLHIGSGGIMEFGGVQCVVKLGDLPSSVYQRVNQYLLCTSSFSFSALLLCVC